MGASAIILPGTTVQKQATLAPLTVSEAGSTLNASTIYIGAPATPIKVQPTSTLCLAHMWSLCTASTIKFTLQAVKPNFLGI